MSSDDPDSDSTWTATFDGASRGNPGPAAVGATLSRDGETVATTSRTIGPRTNNVAEYLALLGALKLADNHDVSNLDVEGDSELIIKQVRGEYDTNEKLSEYRERVMDLVDEFEAIEFVHVNREQNTEADRLANEALDADTQNDEPSLGQTIEVVPEGESALETMQQIDHLSDAELGVLLEDTINGERHYFCAGPGSCWVEFRDYPNHPGDVQAHRTDDVDGYIELNRGNVAIVPVERMPFFGDGSLEADEIFETPAPA